MSKQQTDTDSVRVPSPTSPTLVQRQITEGSQHEVPTASIADQRSVIDAHEQLDHHIEDDDSTLDELIEVHDVGAALKTFFECEQTAAHIDHYFGQTMG